MYITEKITAEISVEKYLEEYVDVAQFLECCKACSNYLKKWSCPPYSFDVEEYWRGYKNLFLLGYIITIDHEARDKSYTSEELRDVMNGILSKEKDGLTEELYGMESEMEGSISLSAGSCGLCGGGMMGDGECTRGSCGDANGDPSKYCRQYDKMRYSIEALGGNVGKTCSKLLGVELEWIEEGKLPKHFVLAGGLLTK